mmetsp:Transcript_31770/g.69502  ORF Transcript_31770/g.69502 Transcript_31770/m.69502 type:complete len:217 (-) Transcript_31770:673-1323(-)
MRGFVPENSSAAVTFPSGRSLPPRLIAARLKWSTAGKKKHARHALSSSPWNSVRIDKKMNGMIKLTTPPPRLPHPPTVDFASPTMFDENISETHDCEATNDARPMPIKQRQMMKPAAVWTKIIAISGGVVSSKMRHMLRRGPIRSHAKPISSLKTTAAEAVDMAAAAVSSLVSFKLSMMYGSSGAGENVEKKVAKKPHQDKWKAIMCGCATDPMRR